MRSKLSLSLLISLLSACATLPDVMVCTELSPVKGFCTKTIADEDVIIDEQHPYAFEPGDKPMTWWEMRPFMVLVPFRSWEAFKEYVIKRCKRDPKGCSEHVASWERKITSLEPGAPK